MEGINGTIAGTLSEERIGEICRQNLLNPASEELVIGIVRECDKDINDPEKDAALIKERIKGNPDAGAILCAILDVVQEFITKKRCY